MDKLAVIGIGDIRQRDKGLPIYLLNQMENVISKEDVSFLHLEETGKSLYHLIADIEAEKILILDTDTEIIEAGDLNYLRLSFKDSKAVDELLVVTFGIIREEWGQQLSDCLLDSFSDFLAQMFVVVNDLLN